GGASGVDGRLLLAGGGESDGDRHGASVGSRGEVSEPRNLPAPMSGVKRGMYVAMHGKSLAAVAVAALTACSSHGGPAHGSGASEGTGGPSGAPRPTVTIFALAELRGQIEPCGCTTDPLGDLARTAALGDAARAQGPAIVVDAGSTLFDLATVPPHRVDQEKLKGDLIVSTYADRLKVAAWGLGPADLGLGAAAVRPPRQAANVDPAAGIA